MRVGGGPGSHHNAVTEVGMTKISNARALATRSRSPRTGVVQDSRNQVVSRREEQGGHCEHHPESISVADLATLVVTGLSLCHHRAIFTWRHDPDSIRIVSLDGTVSHLVSAATAGHGAAGNLRLAFVKRRTGTGVTRTR